MAEIRNRVVVPGSEKQRLPDAEVIDDAPVDEWMDVTVRVRRRQPLPELQGSDAPLQTHMSVEEYAANYGADPADFGQVEEFARQQGLTVEYSDVARRSVLLSGAAAAFCETFGVDLNRCRHATGTFRVREGVIYVPANLGEIVVGVFGLDDRPFARQHCRTCRNAARKTEVSCGVPVLPAGLFQTEPAQLDRYPAMPTGKEQTIGIIELGGGFRAAELRTYLTWIGLAAASNVTVASLPGLGSNPPDTPALDPRNADVEMMLDIEVAGETAPEANIVVYFAPDTQDQSFLDVMTAAVTDATNRPSTLSVSWGGPEQTATRQFQDNFDQVLQTAAHLGITVCMASRDNSGCERLLKDQLCTLSTTG